jgi:universal stress protein A
MSPIRRIVVPIDFSETSDAALDTAIAYAAFHKAEVSLVNVLRTTDYVMGSGMFLWTADMLRQAEDEARQTLELRAAIVRKAGVSVDLAVLNGIPEGEIVHYAEGVGADLIVMGTHGRTGLSRIAMGSVAERVVAHAPCPVMLVRGGATKSGKAPA